VCDAGPGVVEQYYEDDEFYCSDSTKTVDERVVYCSATANLPPLQPTAPGTEKAHARPSLPSPFVVLDVLHVRRNRRNPRTSQRRRRWRRRLCYSRISPSLPPSLNGADAAALPPANACGPQDKRGRSRCTYTTTATNCVATLGPLPAAALPAAALPAPALAAAAALT